MDSRPSSSLIYADLWSETIISGDHVRTCLDYSPNRRSPSTRPRHNQQSKWRKAQTIFDRPDFRSESNMDLDGVFIGVLISFDITFASVCLEGFSRFSNASRSDITPLATASTVRQTWEVVKGGANYDPFERISSGSFQFDLFHKRA